MSLPNACPTCGTTGAGPAVCAHCRSALRDIQQRALSTAYEVALARHHRWTDLERRLNRLEEEQERRREEREREAALRAELERREAIEREQASRDLAQRSLLHYIERKIPGYMSGFLHEDMCRRIENFVGEVAAGKSPRLILAVAPRLGKSEIASDSAPAWILGQHPDWSVIISSYSQDLPVKFSRNVRAQLQSDEYRTVFPGGARLSPDDAGAEAWTTTRSGGVRAAGVGGAILGFGANILIVDDPVKNQEEADSPTALDKVYEWFSSTAYSRLMPLNGIIVVMQRWSTDDLVGRLLARQAAEEKELVELREEVARLRALEDPSPEDLAAATQYELEANELDESMDRWDYVSYPALAVGDEYLTPGGQIVTVPAGSDADPLWRPIRKKDESVHPERFPRHYYLKIKRANPKRFQSMYQLDPQDDEGEFFSVSDFQRYPFRERPDPKFLHVVCAWDLAIGVDKRNDHTVGIAYGVDHTGRRWALDLVRGKFNNYEKVADMVIDLHLKWGAAITGVERTQLEMALAPIIKRRMRERNQYITMAEGKNALRPITDKFKRATPLQAIARNGNYAVPEGEDWDAYIRRMVKFGNTNIDDDVDATAWAEHLASSAALPNDPHARPGSDEPARKGWLEDMMDKMFGGGDGGFMSS
jgi:predicted phage terminase large subunit-like protein